MALIDKLKAIGDAIRSKTGSEQTYTLAEMPEAILSIEAGSGGASIDWGYQLEAYTGTYTPYTNESGIYMQGLPSDYVKRIFVILIWATEESNNAGINRSIIRRTGNGYALNAEHWGKPTSSYLGETNYITTDVVAYNPEPEGAWMRTVSFSDSSAMSYAANRDYAYLCILKKD